MRPAQLTAPVEASIEGQYRRRDAAINAIVCSVFSIFWASFGGFFAHGLGSHNRHANHDAFACRNWRPAAVVEPGSRLHPLMMLASGKAIKWKRLPTCAVTNSPS